MADKTKLSVIILAAGQGTRMKSPLPKVLHPIAGTPMIARVINAAKSFKPAEIRVVVGHGKTLVEQVIIPMGVSTHEQKERKGTAHAVMAADCETLSGSVLILNGDHPLIRSEDINKALTEFNDLKADVAVLTCVLKKPKEFGRVIRQGGNVQAIVEVKDASNDTLKINEINTGAYIVRAEILKEFLPQIKPNNKQNEFYLTDLVALCVENRKKVLGVQVSQRFAFGINDQVQLAKATSIVNSDKIKDLMVNGVIFIKPETCYVEDEVRVGTGVVIYPNAFIKGFTDIGDFTVIEPNCFILSSKIGSGVQIKMGSHLEKVVIHDKSEIGPYARLRPETEIGAGAKVGNFVEMKKVKFGEGSKASHLAYLGDAKIGKDVNIGCGTITCNYAVDKKKYETIIGDGVFVGSDSQFVAPVTIGAGAIIGSGSTITKDVPADALGVARAKQANVENYAKRLKK
ncbi:MAG: bifunctional UDP-N-acetylglucosamine diphosphorylase/glucosamine-1-phosphate N-acetyltransferase GlmU [Bdellovibrionota bacterium]